MVGLRLSRNVVVLLVTVCLTFAGTPAAVAGSISDGVWTHNDGPINCTFYGIHYTYSGYAYARTEDDNGGCANLKVRLKYKRSSDGLVITTAWTQTSGSWIQIQSGWPGVAVASQHQALNGWRSIWSTIRQPHAW
jgi:hypothetical protein